MRLTGAPYREGKGYRLELAFVRDRADVRMLGEIDVAAAPDVARLLGSLDVLDMTIQLDLTAVTFIDSSGLKPVIEATRRRRDLNMPPVLLVGCSRQARRLLDCGGLGGEPALDVEAWDRLGMGPAAVDADARLARVRRSP